MKHKALWIVGIAVGLALASAAATVAAYIGRAYSQSRSL